MRFSPECLTVTFNIARLKESEKKYEEAARIYGEILAKFPDYVNCACSSRCRTSLGCLFPIPPPLLWWPSCRCSTVAVRLDPRSLYLTKLRRRL